MKSNIQEATFLLSLIIWSIINDKRSHIIKLNFPISCLAKSSPKVDILMLNNRIEMLLFFILFHHEPGMNNLEVNMVTYLS